MNFLLRLSLFLATWPRQYVWSLVGFEKVGHVTFQNLKLFHAILLVFTYCSTPKIAWNFFNLIFRILLFKIRAHDLFMMLFNEVTWFWKLAHQLVVIFGIVERTYYFVSEQWKKWRNCSTRYCLFLRIVPRQKSRGIFFSHKGRTLGQVSDPTTVGKNIDHFSVFQNW